MKARILMAAIVSAASLITLPACTVMRDQQTAGAYVDDAVVTSRVKAKFAEDKTVSAMAISVETLNGVVQLSGFAKSNDERMMAEKLARSTSGVVAVRNDIIVRS